MVRHLQSAIRAHPGLGRLATARWASQFGDGIFQAALTGAVFFNPRHHTNPIVIATGLAVVLVPYSIVGPFAGAVLDRWDRRSAMVGAFGLRVVLMLATAAALMGGGSTRPIFFLALVAVGISRFVQAGLGAALPHVVEESWIVGTNAALATTSALVAAVGASLSFTVVTAVGSHGAGTAGAVAVGAVSSIVAAIAVFGFRPGQLGPDNVGRHPSGRAAISAVGAGLVIGARSVWSSGEVTTAMIGLAVQRMVFGVDTLIMFMTLNSHSRERGLVGFGVGIGAVAAGMFIASVLTPIVIPRLGRSRTVVAFLAFALIAQLLLAANLHPLTLIIAAFPLSFAGQMIKLTADASIQIDITDRHRGQVFALQDAVFNIGFVLAIAIAAVWLHHGGSLGAVAVSVAGLYVLGLTAVIVSMRRPESPRQTV